MPRQDWDPLADTIPPRYAFESDDEDETGLLRVVSGTVPDSPSLEISFLPPVKEVEARKDHGGVLIIASGAAGAAWARGAKLGEQIGQVNVNKRAIGLVFRPTWVDQEVVGTVLISEALSRLPVWAMNPYAAAILEQWKPSRVILLDAYSTATYIAATPIPHHEAPLRYLGTERTAPSSSVSLSLFAPPNLLQTTTAAFLSLLALPPSKSHNPPTGFAILVPSRRAPLPTPRRLPRDEEGEWGVDTGLAGLSIVDYSEDWGPAVLSEGHRAILRMAGATEPFEEWSDVKTPGSPKVTGRRRRATETEGGMYI